MMYVATYKETPYLVKQFTVECVTNQMFMADHLFVVDGLFSDFSLHKSQLVVGIRTHCSVYKVPLTLSLATSSTEFLWLR